MQNSMRVTTVIAAFGLALLASAPAAEASPVRQFDVGYGWDPAFAYGQAEPIVFAAPHPGSDSIAAFEAAREAESAEAVHLVAPREASMVPIPGSLVLFASGLLVLAFAGRRSARRTVPGVRAAH